jgi:hypothetical protein
MDNDPPNGRRLSGWKEIAAYLGKGVRTVQRWEKTFRLPVHRIGQGGGEIVYAFIEELERWRLTTEAAAAGERRNGAASTGAADAGSRESAADVARPPKPTPVRLSGRIKWTAAVAVLCFSLAAVLLLVVLPRLSGGGVPSTSRKAATVARGHNPDHVRFAAGKLRVFDAAGFWLWDATFDRPATEADFEEDRTVSSRRRTAVEDLDGDGQNEVLAVHGDLFCFNADGSRRFVVAVGREVRFGDTLYKPPFLANGFFITGDRKGPKTIWAIGIHSVWFPSVLSRINARGELLSEYWSDGHITSLTTTTLGGRPIVVVGACNNEKRSGSLAVFDEDSVVGSAPAEQSKYSCRSCGSARPLAFFVFPQTRLAAELDIPTPVLDVKAAGGVLTAVANQSGTVVIPPDPQRLAPAYTYYDFDSDLSILHADVNDGYADTQRRLEQIGRVTPGSRFVSERALFPVLFWAGNRFVPIYVSKRPQ